MAKFLLNNEHASTAELPTLQRYLRTMKQLAVELPVGDRTLIERPEFASRLARFEAEVKAVAMMVQRVAAIEGDGGRYAHALGSMLKIRGTELQQRMSAFLAEMLGDHGAVADPGPVTEAGPITSASLALRDVASDITAEMFFRRAATIYGGTSEVQRGIVAKHLFGF